MFQKLVYQASYFGFLGLIIIIFGVGMFFGGSRIEGLIAIVIGMSLVALNLITELGRRGKPFTYVVIPPQHDAGDDPATWKAAVISIDGPAEMPLHLGYVRNWCGTEHRRFRVRVGREGMTMAITGANRAHIVAVTSADDPAHQEPLM